MFNRFSCSPGHMMTVAGLCRTSPDGSLPYPDCCRTMKCNWMIYTTYTVDCKILIKIKINIVLRL